MLNATDCQLLNAEPFQIQETTNYNPVMYECVQQKETARGIMDCILLVPN